MPKVRKDPATIPQEWLGFPNRLRQAVAQRMSENPGLTQNEIGRLVHISSGHLAKLMKPFSPESKSERRVGANAPTVLLLAKILRVHLLWLMTGIEPSGLETPGLAYQFLHVPMPNAPELSPSRAKKPPKKPPRNPVKHPRDRL